MITYHVCWSFGPGKKSQQEDRGIGGSDSLVNRIMVTSPDDNHVIITMPTADSTRPASYVTRSSQNSSNEDPHAAPSDSAYSADALPPSQASQPQSGAGQHDSSTEQWQQQQQQVARSSRSHADMGRQHLQKQPGQKQPKNESASEHSPERSSDPAERQASLQTASATRLSASIHQYNNSEFGHSPELGEDLMQNQQFDALQEQLHGLVQASQGINESLLHVHQQLESLKSK